MRRTQVPSRRPRRTDDGVGAIGSLVGVLVVWLVLAVSVHVLLGAWASSRVAAAADDAARLAALAEDPAGGREAAEQMLGQRFGERLVAVAWSQDADRIRVTITVDGPSLLPPPAPFDEITRSGGRRVERFR